MRLVVCTMAFPIGLVLAFLQSIGVIFLEVIPAVSFFAVLGPLIIPIICGGAVAFGVLYILRAGTKVVIRTSKKMRYSWSQCCDAVAVTLDNVHCQTVEHATLQWRILPEVLFMGLYGLASLALTNITAPARENSTYVGTTDHITIGVEVPHRRPMLYLSSLPSPRALIAGLPTPPSSIGMSSPGSHFPELYSTVTSPLESALEILQDMNSQEIMAVEKFIKTLRECRTDSGRELLTH